MYCEVHCYSWGTCVYAWLFVYEIVWGGRTKTRERQRKTRTSDIVCVFVCNVAMYMHWFMIIFSYKDALKGDTEGHGEFSLQRPACSHPVSSLPQLWPHQPLDIPTQCTNTSLSVSTTPCLYLLNHPVFTFLSSKPYMLPSSVPFLPSFSVQQK